MGKGKFWTNPKIKKRDKWDFIIKDDKRLKMARTDQRVGNVLNIEERNEK